MEILELMRILLYFMTNYTPYWRKFPSPGLKIGYWATCKLEAMRFSVERKYKCYQLKETVSRICGIFCLTIPNLDVEKRVKKWTDNWWTYLLFAVRSSRQVSHFENILWVLGPLSKCSEKKGFMWTFMSHAHMKVRQTMLGAAQPQITSVMVSLSFLFPK